MPSLHNQKFRDIKRTNNSSSLLGPFNRRNSFIPSPENEHDFIRQIIPSSNQDTLAYGLDCGAKLWIGKDYVNFIVKDFSNLDKPFDDAVDRHTTPRMPWHDVSCAVIGAAARDVARHFIQRWNYTKFNKVKFDERYSWLIPKTYANADQIELPYFLNRAHKTTCQVVGLVSKLFLPLTSG